jgi:hypothetical protein
VLRVVLGIVGIMETGALRCDLRFSEFLVCKGEVRFEVGPIFVCWWSSSPLSTCIGEEPSLEYTVVCDSDDLWDCILGSVGGICEIDSIFNLIK